MIFLDFRPGCSRVPRGVRHLRGLPPLLLALWVLTGCSDSPSGPGTPDPATLVISLTPPSAGPIAPAAATAFGKANGVRVRLLRGTATALDRTLQLAAQGASSPISVEVQASDQAETFGLEVTLLFGGDPLFVGTGTVELRSGVTTPTAPPLEPVVAGIAISPNPVLFESIGEEIALSGHAAFASGDAFPGSSLTWSLADPSVAELSTNGVLRALEAGETQLTGSWQTHTSSVPVRVVQKVVAAEVSPADFSLSINDERTLDLILRDALANPVPATGRAVQWASADENVATVDGTGRVRGIGFGTTTITVTVDGVSGESRVTVRDGFRHDFKTGLEGWSGGFGSWSHSENEYLRGASSVGDSWIAAYHPGTWSDFRIEARMRRVGCADCSNALVLRADGSEDVSAGSASVTYLFNYTNQGAISVWFKNGTIRTPLQNWAAGNSLVTGESWNNLAVELRGGSMRFLVNDVVVWEGFHAALSAGRVGIGMYVLDPGDELYVDWVDLQSYESEIQNVRIDAISPWTESVRANEPAADWRRSGGVKSVGRN
jgi:hypothetical protein